MLREQNQMLSVVCNYWFGFPKKFVKLNETVKLNVKKLGPGLGHGRHFIDYYFSTSKEIFCSRTHIFWQLKFIKFLVRTTKL